MFTSTIKDFKKDNGFLRVLVEFTDGVDVVTKVFDLTVGNTYEFLKNQIANYVDGLDLLYSIPDTLKVGSFDSKSLDAQKGIA